MKQTGQPPTIPTRQQDWITAGLTTITVATLMAAVAVGAYVTIIGGQGSFAHLAGHTPWPTLIFSALVVTLIVYLFVVATGMSTVFTTDEQRRHERVKKAAFLFYCQVFSVIFFAFLLTLAVFTYDSDASTTVGQTAPASCCPEYCSADNTTREDAQKRPGFQGKNWCR